MICSLEPVPDLVRKLAGAVWAVDAPLVGPVEIDSTTLSVQAIITTASPDRAGDLIEPSGLQNAEEYLRNPVVLWAHDRSRPPIGTCVRLEVRPKSILARTQFVRGMAFAEEVFDLYRRGVLRAWSIGFIPRKARTRTHRDGRRGLLVQEWELLEYSAVPVPENPAALTSHDVLRSLIA